MTILSGGNALLDPGFILSRARVGADMKVADLGCGNGYFIFGAADLVGKRGRVYAVDILKTVLENVDKRIRQNGLENMETVWSNLEIFGATNIESGSLDVAMLINTLYQSHKRIEIIKESIRMLKKDGILLIVEWKNISSPLGPPVEERVKIEPLKAACQNMGLKLEEEFEAGAFHYGLIYTKI